MKTLNNPTLDELKRMEIFHSVSDAELKHISSLMERQFYKAGEVLIEESTPGTKFFVVLSGSLAIRKRMNGGEETLNIIDVPGKLLGEMSLVDNRPRSAGIVAIEDSEVLMIPKQGFLDLVTKFPAFTLEVAKSISQYVRKTDEKLIEALEEKNQQLEKTILELHKTRKIVVERERLSMIGRMAGTILHDLKTPMTTIAGFAQLMAMKKVSYDEMVKYSGIIKRQVGQFNVLAQELIGLSQGSTSQMLTPVDLNDTLDELLHDIEFTLIQNKMSLRKSFKCHVKVMMDKRRFFRVFENLTSNAIEAMNTGGILTFGTEQKGNMAFIHVSDTGHGMDPDVTEKVFDEFFSYQKHMGAGLGLAIVKRIVEDHWGTVTVKSTPDAGTTFTIELPIINSKD